ncbi:PR domain zinc finger protein 13 [Blyttiomyces sp. JEL0837]|nr:PR domain zinc finger protein 13 [Blyttiomyces sp. JEL0837]
MLQPGLVEWSLLHGIQNDIAMQNNSMMQTNIPMLMNLPNLDGFAQGLTQQQQPPEVMSPFMKAFSPVMADFGAPAAPGFVNPSDFSIPLSTPLESVNAASPEEWLADVATVLPKEQPPFMPATPNNNNCMDPTMDINILDSLIQDVMIEPVVPMPQQHQIQQQPQGPDFFNNFPGMQMQMPIQSMYIKNEESSPEPMSNASSPAYTPETTPTPVTVRAKSTNNKRKASISAPNGSPLLALANSLEACELISQHDDDEFSVLAANAALPSANPRKKQRPPKHLPCNVCSKVFTRNYNLQIHMLSHTGERNHVCEFCSTPFARVHDLRRHIRCLHSYEKPYVCSFDGCDEAFPRADALSRHMKVDHDCDM